VFFQALLQIQIGCELPDDNLKVSKVHSVLLCGVHEDKAGERR
jgi:hypothetical protein